MRNRGQILIIVNVLMSVLLLYSLALVNLSLAARRLEKTEDAKLSSENIAEAGIEKAAWCFNQTSGTNCGGTYGSNYNGETNVSFGNGIYDVFITTIDLSTKEIEATAYFPNKTKILSKSIIKARVSTDVDRASFIYGAQTGQGGLDMGESSALNGSIYSLGNMTGDNGAVITGDAYAAGGTALAADQSHTEKNNDFTFGKTSPYYDLAQSFTSGESNVLNKIGLYIKKVGSPSDISIRIENDSAGTPGGSVYASASLDSSDVSTSYGWIDVSFASPPLLDSGTKYWIILDAGSSSSKYWIIGADAFGNYPGGEMLYSSDASGGLWYANGYDLNFKTWMGGVDTGIDNIDINGNAYAHYLKNLSVQNNAKAYSIENSTITKNAWADSIDGSDIGQNATSTSIIDSSVGQNLWCETYSNTSVGGSRFCPTSITPPSDPGQIDMPINDALIAEWKTDAENGGIIEGSYSVTQNISLGPKKINGNLSVSTGKILTLTGTIYVTGNIILYGNSQITLTSGYGNSSGIIIADGKITVNNGVIFSGTGVNNYTVAISTYGVPDNDAITVGNAETTVLYAPHGTITIQNNGAVKEAVGYKLKISNSASLNYESGLSDISFSSGPAGGWSLLKGTWRVIE